MVCEVGDLDASFLALLCNRVAVDCKVLRCAAHFVYLITHNDLTLPVSNSLSTVIGNNVGNQCSTYMYNINIMQN